MTHPFADTEIEAIPVKVSNFGEMGHTTVTQEKEAEHYTCSTFTLPQGEIIGTGVGAIEPTQVLQLDPLRKRAVLAFNGTGQIILAHSMQQATSLAQNVQQAADEGALVTSPTTITVEATGPLWAVAVPSTGSQPTQDATGSVTSPGAGANVSGTIGAVNLPAGLYQVTTTIYIDGTPVAGTDDDNMKINQSSGAQFHLIVPITGVPVTQTFFLTFNGAQTIGVSASSAGTAGAVYHAQITATQLPIAGASGNLAIGVTQERRNS